MLKRLLTRLPVYYTDFRDDPGWLVMFTLGRVIWVRRLVAGAGAAPLPPPAVASLFNSGNLATCVTDVEREGISVPAALRLPDRLVSSLVRFARTTKCYGNLELSHPVIVGHDEDKPRIMGDQKMLVAHFFEGVESCDEIGRIRSDPAINFLAQSYLGGGARPISTRLWWSFPATNPGETALKRASQNKLHFDMNDWKSIKFFFYLTDVGPKDGPHVYVRGSHRHKRWRDQITLFVGKENRRLEKFYGKEALMRICGRAGTGFVEDPFGFHMGTLPTRRARLMLEIEFGLSRPTPRRFFGTLPQTA